MVFLSHRHMPQLNRSSPSCTSCGLLLQDCTKNDVSTTSSFKRNPRRWILHRQRRAVLRDRVSLLLILFKFSSFSFSFLFPDSSSCFFSCGCCYSMCFVCSLTTHHRFYTSTSNLHLCSNQQWYVYLYTVLFQGKRYVSAASKPRAPTTTLGVL